MEDNDGGGEEIIRNEAFLLSAKRQRMRFEREKEKVKYVNMGKEERAVKHLMGKHNLGGTIEQHLKTYNAEIEEVTKRKLGRKLSANEVKALKKQGVKIIMTRVNPEWHKADHDHPDGRSKMPGR